MAVDTGLPPRAATLPAIPFHRRLYGFGSIYGKTIRDSRLGVIIVTGLIAATVLVSGQAFAADYFTPESRKELADLIASIPPVMQGIYGNPVNITTIGGTVEWKVGGMFTILVGLWSILALSATLAGEARRGSLDLVAAAPFGKRRVALEKLSAHLTAVTLSMAVVAFTCWATGVIFATVPGDEIPPQAAIGFALKVGLIGLASGSVAFALAPVVGRASAAGVAGAVMLGGYIVSGYAASVPAFAAVANLTWFHWTFDHAPLSGQYDWLSLVPVALVAIVLFAVGVELFARRDLGVMTPIRVPGLPRATLGLHGPVGRAFGDQLPRAIAWGIALGLFGFMLAAASRSFADAVADLSGSTLDLLRSWFPGFDDLTTAGGFLSLYLQLLFIVAGFAGATYVSKWASDETDGRLEMLLATPLARARWAVAGGIGGFVAVAVMTAMLATGVAIGATFAGSEASGPAAGSAMLGLYAAAMVGVGVAIGGLWRTSLAAELVAAVVMATFLLDLLAPALKLPDWIHQLSLTAHFGRPMLGDWDPVGIVACLVIAVVGVALGAWGMSRRDIAR
jgi:ABC-2 type transport system permease protein